MASVAGAMGDPSTDINFVNFNQDCSSLAIGTRTGYKLLSLSSVDKLELIYESACRYCYTHELYWILWHCNSGMSQLLNDYFLLPSLPWSPSPPHEDWECVTSRKVETLNWQSSHFSNKGTEICQYSYSNTILAVKLNRARLVVCLEEALYIHNIRDMKVGWVLLPQRTSTLLTGAAHNQRHTTEPKRALRSQYQ